MEMVCVGVDRARPWVGRGPRGPRWPENRQERRLGLAVGPDLAPAREAEAAEKYGLNSFLYWSVVALRTPAEKRAARERGERAQKTTLLAQMDARMRLVRSCAAAELSADGLQVRARSLRAQAAQDMAQGAYLLQRMGAEGTSPELFAELATLFEHVLQTRADAQDLQKKADDLHAKASASRIEVRKLPRGIRRDRRQLAALLGLEPGR